MGRDQRPAVALRELRATNTLVIVDTPPLLAVSDARLVAPHADGVLLLVAAGTQRPAHLASALERLKLVDANLLGVVLNKSSQETRSGGGYYAYLPRSGPKLDEVPPEAEPLPPVESTH